MKAQAEPTGSREVLFRTDASAVIGTGHLARSLTLADELRAHGWRATVASRGLADDFRADIRARGHEVLELGTEMALHDEPAHIGAVLAGRPIALTVVDHYAIAAPWHRAARHWSRRLMAIDDLAEPSLDVDVVLNQNLGERGDAYRDLVPPSAELLVGPRYALLRPQFAEARGKAPRVRESVERLLIFMSGSDEHDLTTVAVAAAARAGIEADVVIGAAYPYETRLRAFVARSPGITVHRNVVDMATLMSRADLAIGAPSSASWERCCLALPAILVTLAANQVRAGAALAAAGAAVDLGWYTDVDETRLAAAVLELAAAPDRLAAMSRAAAAVTDGRGTRRVRGAIERLTGRGGDTNA